MNMTLHSSINGKIIVAHGEVSNEPTEKQRGRDELIKRRSDGALYYLDRIWVPLKGDVRTLIMDETHKSRLKAIRDRQKSYVDKRRKPLECSVGDHVLLKVSPWKGVDTSHVSNLKKCLADPTLQIPVDGIQVDTKLNFVEKLVEILERELKKLKWNRITIVKVRWILKQGTEFTWEREDKTKL
ncbi:hypothetical protein Tco_0077440 [Tanacetum coccineum]